MLNGLQRLFHSLLVASLSPHTIVPLAAAQEQAIRAPVGSVLKTQETMLTAPHLKDKTTSQVIANLRTQKAKQGKVEEKDPCAHTYPCPAGALESVRSMHGVRSRARCACVSRWP